jgi:hypothetical protein
MTRTKCFSAIIGLLITFQLAGQDRDDAQAKITVFTSKDMAMSAYSVNKTRVYVDSVARYLPADTFFTVAVPPGKHTVSSGAKMLIARREELDLDLKPGDHVYVLESLELGQWRARLALRTVRCADIEGRNLATKLKPSKDRNGLVVESQFPSCEKDARTAPASSLR